MQDNNILDKDSDDLIDEEHFLEIFISYNYKFEILSEEDEEIETLNDILRMEDLECPYGHNEEMMWEQIIKQQNKINKLIKAVKQLNKKLEEK